MMEVTILGVDKAAEVGSPLYIHPSDSPGAPLVPVPFDGIGYRSWRRGILRSLSVKNNLGFINGECKKPASNDPNCRLWEMCDDMVTSWILNSLSREVADNVEYIDNALKLWTVLEDRYDQTNGAKLYQIQKEINDLSQRVLDITTYYTRMKKLWEELSNLCIKSLCKCACTCGAKKNMHKVEQNRRLIQFLMELNEVYTVIRENILMMNPLPSMAQAFAILIHEEKQREFKPNSQMFAESSSLMASTSGHLTARSSGTSGTSGGKDFRTNYSFSSTNYRGRPFCEHCRKPGHTKVKCFKIHGYPQNFNHNPQHSNNYGNNRFQKQQHYGQQNSNQNYRYNNKGKGVAANSVGLSCDFNMEQGSGSGSQGDNQNINIKKDQYEQLTCILQQFQGVNTTENSSNMQVTGPAENFAGIIACTSSINFNKLSCECYKEKADL